jgi:hypothetical protein
MRFRRVPEGNAMMLSELAESMFRFSPSSDAWRDFAADCRERLGVASLTDVAGVDTPTDFSDYWLSVVWGDGGDYAPDGARTLIR